MSKDQENDDHIYSAWRKFEAYQVPVTEEAEYRMMLRWNAYKAGWIEALEQPAKESMSANTSGTFPLPKIRYESYQWQGLSDDEIKLVISTALDINVIDITKEEIVVAHAIETKLKEKNNG
jgi:hypothetical protein